MDDLVSAIEAALERKGLSASAASQLAVGNPSMIKNLKNRRTERERSHPVDNLKALADVLDLEFYFGPRREPSVVHEMSGELFSLVPHYSTALLSGDHVLELARAPDEHFAFPNEWFLRGRLKPEQCILFTALSANMAPAISDGDLVMADRKATALRNGKVYAYQTEEDGFCIARLELVPGRVLIARSDNPDTKQFPPKYYSGEEIEFVQAGILGEVIWSGHTWR
ncbi:S24 family peptidase [Salipiger thiooxidans]|uniref:S24 family peptidase n=1 Tax=Salipiger thiooxidans TaxID=282683 RepID=UPI001A8E7766|nr:S24 family peptidase [Salipiger thiooxidans]MBN8190243.1 S24 family peptidase [Salipiger thiooxidans]